MSIAAFALNGLLAVLLIVALGFGWRLERRLKALRDSHAGFAKAVADLDNAAARAEQGLADLRAATDEASETLADRIERATALAAKLDERLSRPLVTPPPAAAPAAAAPRPELEPKPDRRLKAEDFERLLDREAKATRPADPSARPTTLSRPRTDLETPRSRARVDDDLFEGPVDPPRPGPNFRAR
ncbi:MAG: flagellar positioning protein PflI [Alphaproteobacteria bacterium]|nr:flagellar positioning protein PflI [Alphaproteobacteria bacterium]